MSKTGRAMPQSRWRQSEITISPVDLRDVLLVAIRALHRQLGVDRRRP